MMMIPPTSGRKAVRLQHASVITELSSLYSALMSVWITEAPDNKDRGVHSDEQDGVAGEKEAQRISITPTIEAPWVDSLRTRTISLHEQLQAIQMASSMAKFEGSIRGAWPSELYTQLLGHERDMTAAIGQVSAMVLHSLNSCDSLSAAVKRATTP